jgi:hypothetical protein
LHFLIVFGYSEFSSAELHGLLMAAEAYPVAIG